jgi:hypothetical protein
VVAAVCAWAERACTDTLGPEAGFHTADISAVCCSCHKDPISRSAAERGNALKAINRFVLDASLTAIVIGLLVERMEGQWSHKLVEQMAPPSMGLELRLIYVCNNHNLAEARILPAGRCTFYFSVHLVADV